ncbi:hypothetical protein QTP88_020171 [Uroleucon formosanum]
MFTSKVSNSMLHGSTHGEAATPAEFAGRDRWHRELSGMDEKFSRAGDLSVRRWRTDDGGGEKNRLSGLKV